MAVEVSYRGRFIARRKWLPQVFSADASIIVNLTAVAIAFKPTIKIIPPES
jgi:DNA phosphorothioation-dependent restriction protein DptG